MMKKMNVMSVKGCHFIITLYNFNLYTCVYMDDIFRRYKKKLHFINSLQNYIANNL